MLKRKLNITYNTVEAIDFVLQSNDKDIDEVVHNKILVIVLNMKMTKMRMLHLFETMNKVKIFIQSNKVIQLKSPKSRGQRKNMFLGQ